MTRRIGAEFSLNGLMVLLLLNEREEMYGMEIVRWAAERTSDSQANVGTIYPLLKDLARDGLLSSRRASGSPRIYYRLTDRGRAELPYIAGQLEHVNNAMGELLALATAARQSARTAQAVQRQ